jgi:hypothetical protein
MSSSRTHSFRSAIVERDTSCRVTGFDASTCDAAHIIPAYVCQRLGLNCDLAAPANGLLLCKNLHSSFDNFFWTFDVFDSMESAIPNEIYLPIIINRTDLALLVKDYQFDNTGHKMYYRIPVECLPYLYIHYLVWAEVFLRKQNVPLEREVVRTDNKLILRKQNVPMVCHTVEEQLYRSAIDSVPFYLWRRHHAGLTHLLRSIEHRPIWFVIATESTGRCLVHRWASPWSETEYVAKESLPQWIKT